MSGGPVHGRRLAEVIAAAAISLGANAHPEQDVARASASNRMWKVLLGLLYLAVGVYMLMNPGPGLVAVVLVLAWLFLVQGVISIFGALQLRPLPGWRWWLFDGIITLLLALMVFSGWPGNSVRIIAIVVGISLIISGVNRLASAAR